MRVSSDRATLDHAHAGRGGRLADELIVRRGKQRGVLLHERVELLAVADSRRSDRLAQASALPRRPPVVDPPGPARDPRDGERVQGDGLVQATATAAWHGP